MNNVNQVGFSDMIREDVGIIRDYFRPTPQQPSPTDDKVALAGLRTLVALTFTLASCQVISAVSVFVGTIFTCGTAIGVGIVSFDLLTILRKLENPSKESPSTDSRQIPHSSATSGLNHHSLTEQRTSKVDEREETSQMNGEALNVPTEESIVSEEETSIAQPSKPIARTPDLSKGVFRKIWSRIDSSRDSASGEFSITKGTCFPVQWDGLFNLIRGVANL